MNTTLTVAALTVASLATSALAVPTWTEVDAQTSTTTRSQRGLGLNGDGTLLYSTFIQGSTSATVRSYTLAGLPPAGTQANEFNISGYIGTGAPGSDNTQAEAVVVDDRGIVFAALVKSSTSDNNSKVAVFSSGLATPTSISLEKITSSNTSETIGGVDFRLDGSTRQLYVSRFRSDTAYIERYVIGGTNAATATLTLDTTFNATGRFDLKTLHASADNLRGIDVAADGTIYVASREDNTVYRLASDLSSVSTATVSNAMDLALYNGDVYVTQYAGTSSAIQSLDAATLALGESFTATGTFSRGANSGYAGIDIDALGRAYVVDQYYGGTSSNLSDRILVSSAVPEPASLGLLALGGMLLGRRRR